MKKLISSVIAVLTAAVFFSFSAFADRVYDDFEELLLKEFENYSADIDISPLVDKYGLSVDDTVDTIRDVYYSHPELYYVENGFQYMYGHHLLFDYFISANKLADAQKKMDEAAKKAVAGITDDMSDVQKALYVHDYLILNCAYDNSLLNYSAYDCMIGRSCTCQGYSLAYEYILNNYLGIECSFVISEAANHIWNYVKIDGKWYHVDLTFDDRLDYYKNNSYDRNGFVLHENFLMSDSKCRKTSTSHTNWYIPHGLPAARDTAYDNAFWNGVESRICFVNGNCYYTADGGKTGNKRMVEIHRYDPATGADSVVLKLKCRWFMQREGDTGITHNYGEYYYNNIFSSLEQINGKLYFNSGKSVYSFNLSTKKLKKLYTLDKGADQQIFGMALYDGKLRLSYRKDITYPESYLKLVLK